MIKSTKAEFQTLLQTQKHDTHEHNDAAADVRRSVLKNSATWINGISGGTFEQGGYGVWSWWRLNVTPSETIWIQLGGVNLEVNLWVIIKARMPATYVDLFWLFDLHTSFVGRELFWVSQLLRVIKLQVCPLLFDCVNAHFMLDLISGRATDPYQYMKQPLDLWLNYFTLRDRVQGGFKGRSIWWHIYLLIDVNLSVNKLRVCTNIKALLSWINGTNSLIAVWHKMILGINNSDFYSISGLITYQVACCSIGRKLSLLFSWQISVFLSLFWDNLGNKVTTGIDEFILIYFPIKRFPYQDWCINLHLVTPQSVLCINSKLWQTIFHHQMPFFPYCNLIVKFCSFLFQFLNMASSKSSANNNTTTDNSQNLPPNPDTLEYCLVGKLLINKPVRFHSFKTRMASLWQPKQTVDISQMDPNRFMFQFFNKADMEQAVQGGPWLFDNFPLIWRKISFAEDSYTMPLDHIEMWVQVHNLPFGFMTESMGILLGNHVGRLEKYDHENNYGNWRRFMKLRVAIPVNEPLKKSFEFVLTDGAAVTVNFRYEKLGNFCYVCGLLGHTEGYCQKRFEAGFVEGDNQWGPFLKAEFNGLAGRHDENPWLHDGRRRGRQGGRNGARINEGLNFHRVFGRVMIGRNPNTKELVFYKHIGTHYSSNEWVQFNVENVAVTPDAAQPVGDGQISNIITQVGGVNENQPLLLEGDEERIARLVQEARLKNPVMIGAPSVNVSTVTGHKPQDQPPVSQLAASLAQILRTGVPTSAEPRLTASGMKPLNKPEVPKHLKRIRLEESEEKTADEKDDSDTLVMNRVEMFQSVEFPDVVMNESASAAHDNVMAGPGHQARQGK